MISAQTQENKARGKKKSQILVLKGTVYINCAEFAGKSPSASIKAYSAKWLQLSYVFNIDRCGLFGE